MEARAYLKYARISPRKVQIVLDLIRNKPVDMAVGNAIGSNIFNILMVLGIASAISPLQLIGENVIDIIVLVVFSVVVWIFGATKKEISRTEGIAMICMYLCYSAYIIMR